MRRAVLAVIWPGFRSYDRNFFTALTQDTRLETNIVWIRSFRDDEPPPQALLDAGNWRVVGANDIRIGGYSLRSLAKMVWLVWTAVYKSDAVLTSTQAPLHSKVAFVCAKLLNKKVFIKVEQWAALGRQSFLMRQYKKLDRFMMRHCDQLFPHGASQRNYALALGVHDDRISILPFLSDDLRDCPLTVPGLREALGLTGKKVIIYFGRIIPQKGLMDLLEACVSIREQFDDAVLLVCGGADRHFADYSQAILYEKKCRSYAQAALPGKVRFVGPVDASRKQDYFAISDLFVHPHTNLDKLTDGWGLVLNEAASMSLPIITTDRVGSAPDLVIEGESGYTVPAGDVTQLSARITELIMDDAKRLRFAAASRRAFESYHQPARIAEIVWETMNV